LLNVGEIIFEHYEILHVFQRGPMDGVFLARHSDFPEQRCTIKAMKVTESSVEDLTAKRFRNEILVTYELQHPNIIRSRGYHRDGEMIGLVMEYLPFGNLRDLIDSGQKVSESQIVFLLKEVLNGLAEIHQGGIIHRDMRPENILFGKNNAIKITDFGDARVGATISTGSGITGKLEYLSPEYVRDGTLTETSDIYSLGICAYELATGTKPYEAESPIRALAQRLTQQITPPSEINPECSEEFSDMIVKAMAIEPTERFQTAIEMHKALNELEASAGFVAEPLAPENPPTIPGALAFEELSSEAKPSEVKEAPVETQTVEDLAIKPKTADSEESPLPRALNGSSREKKDKKVEKLIDQVFHPEKQSFQDKLKGYFQSSKETAKTSARNIDVSSIRNLAEGKNTVKYLGMTVLFLLITSAGLLFAKKDRVFDAAEETKILASEAKSGQQNPVPSGWYIEYVRSNDINRAASIAQTLSKQGFPLQVKAEPQESADQEEMIFFKVLIGPYDNNTGASDMLAELDDEGLYKDGLAITFIDEI